MKRVKYISQIQQTECGLCVITMLLNFYGAHYSLYDIRKFVDVGRDGMSVSNVIQVLEGSGMTAKAFRSRNIKDLAQLNTPFIITLQKKHLVIVEKITKNTVHIMDSAIGRIKYSYAELGGLFDGICIEVKPGENFQKKRNGHRMFKLLFSLMWEAKIENVLRAVRIYDEIMQMPMGMNTVISEMGTNLSGGQRQRIIIARELLKEPSLLLLDEATSALDYTNEKRVLEYISGLKITCLIVTHRISSIQNADHILFMKDGEIVERGNHRELMEKRGDYFDMYQNEK